ncbi:MAG: hypothetical protein LIO93_11595, partial [Bacteroidales bacterium]|nr:hypothetical protein [Bacteroidales bacterium]
MNKNSKNIKCKIIVFPFLITALILTSCKDFFDINPDDMLNEENNYKNVGDVYSGFLGLAANFQAVADQYILMAELMGDLLEPTANADVEFWYIYRYKASNGNPEVDPVKFYTIIVNANDFFSHALKYNEENPNAIAENVYLGIMSCAMTFRVWAYLSIVKFYGHAYYFHDLVASLTDISQFKKMEMDELIPELISYLEEGYQGINAFNALNWNDILSNGDYSWNRHSVNPNALITELALWAGDYEKTINEGIVAVTRQGVIGNPDNTTTKYTLNSVYGSANWKNLFNGSYTITDNEAFTVVPFSFSNKQVNRLQYY